jgi:hypothetical protein
MLFFNFKELSYEAKDDPVKMLALLKQLKDNRIFKLGLRQKLFGNSFLLRPDQLLQDKTTDVLYIYQYLLLASKRDYALYTLYGLKGLQLSYHPNINLDSIKTNPLLTITKSEIKFKYEE